MLDFPKATLFNKRIPKQKFYEKLNKGNDIEQQFVREIDTIYWKNKLSAETLNVSTGADVTEIEIFEINLKEQNISKNIIELIDREISYHIVFTLRFINMCQVWISYKEENKSKEGKFKVGRYYKTEWLKYEDLSLKIEGLDLDRIYENLIIQVAGDKLITANGELSIKEAIEKSKDIERLEAYIKRLEKMIKNEKQFNHQVKLMGELRKAKEELASNLK